jgi:hypothetical protein
MARRTIVWSAVCLLVAAFSLFAASPVCAQDTNVIDKAIHARWGNILAEVARLHDVPLESGILKTTPQGRRLIYREALARLSNDPDLLTLAAANLSLVEEATPANERRYIERLREARAEHTQPKSLNATSTNQAAGNIAERSGFTELLALALNG